MNHDFASRFSLFFLFSHLRASDFFRCHTCNHHISLQCPLTSSFPEKKISSLQNKYEILLTKPARTARLLHTLPTYKSAGKLPSNRAVKRGREKTEKCSSEMLSFSPCFFLLPFGIPPYSINSILQITLYLQLCECSGYDNDGNLGLQNCHHFCCLSFLFLISYPICLPLG